MSGQLRDAESGFISPLAASLIDPNTCSNLAIEGPPRAKYSMVRSECSQSCLIYGYVIQQGFELEYRCHFGNLRLGIPVPTLCLEDVEEFMRMVVEHCQVPMGRSVNTCFQMSSLAFQRAGRQAISVIARFPRISEQILKKFLRRNALLCDFQPKFIVPPACHGPILHRSGHSLLRRAHGYLRGTGTLSQGLLALCTTGVPEFWAKLGI
jgi:hypothetical protein